MTDLIAPERYEGVEKTSVGFKLMTSMGWAEGQGLGKDQQGIKKHLTAKKKFDNLGVGTVENDKRRQDWTLQMVNFNSVLGKLQKVSSRHSLASQNEESSDDESDAPEEAATVNEKKRKASKGDEAEGSKKGKKSKKQKKSEAKDGGKSKGKKSKKVKAKKESDSDSGSDSDDAKGAPSTSADSKAPKNVSHVGRFKKREKAKCVKSYSSTDLAAILGQKEEEDNPFAAFAAAATTNKQTPSANKDDGKESDSDSDDGNSEDAEPSSSGKAGQAQAEPEQQDEDDKAEGKAVVSPDDANKWWASMFCRAGVLGSKRETEREEKRGFSEQDQENLYNTAHEKAIKGKQGLGRSGMQKKLTLGNDFAGKKTKIVESDDEEDDQQQDQAAKDASAEPKGAKKWKKIAMKVLRAGGGSMKVKELKKRALEHAGVEKTDAESAGAALLKRVESSSAFRIDGKTVALTKAAK